MKINIVNYEEGKFDGILSKYAYRMMDELTKLGHTVMVTSVPRRDYTINHHINYMPYKKEKGKKTINTLMVTHITTPEKLAILTEGMKTADYGICFSEDTQKYLEKNGIENLTTILPAHDSVPRRLRMVYIPTNVYPDGCKRQEMFLELYKTIDKTKFVFVIMGTGWEDTLRKLEPNGAQVALHNKFDLITHHEALKLADYCLYFGKDEGSMGILDAAHAGVKTIAPEIGFHKEIGIDFPFDTQEELNEIFTKFICNTVEDWNWDNYINQHLELWKSLAKKRKK